MKPAIKFGTSGWRGLTARDFTFANARLVTQAIAQQTGSFYTDRLNIPVAPD